MHRYSTGAVPQLGDSELRLIPDRYVVLGRMLKPLRAPYAATMLDDPEGKDNKVFTQRWLARFDGD